MKKAIIVLVVTGVVVIPAAIFLFNQARTKTFEYNGFKFNYREDEWALEFDEPRPFETPEWTVTQGKLSLSDAQQNTIEINLSDKTIPNSQAQMDIGISEEEMNQESLQMSLNGGQRLYFYCQQLLTGETACELKSKKEDGFYYTYRVSLFGMEKSSIAMKFENNEQYQSRKLALMLQLNYIITEVGD